MKIADCGLPWIKGPALGNDPVGDSKVEVGDRFLVLVECESSGRDRKKIVFWEISVIMATETGWKDQLDNSWYEWKWSNVSWFIKLDGETLPPFDGEIPK